MQGVYLPPELACKLIELEVSIQEETGLNDKSILDLIDCYTKAVQYYNEKGDQRRHLYYQHKMQDLLQRPAITQVLQKGKKSDLTIRKEKNQEEIRKMNHQSQQMAKQMMEHSHQESKKQKMALEATLAKQEKTLEERLERKRANSSRVNRPKMTSASFTCPSSKNTDDILLGKFVELPSPPRKHP